MEVTNERQWETLVFALMAAYTEEVPLFLSSILFLFTVSFLLCSTRTHQLSWWNLSN